MNELVTLAIKTAEKQNYRNDPEILSEGVYALLYALKTYNRERGKLCHWVSYCVRKAIARYTKRAKRTESIDRIEPTYSDTYTYWIDLGLSVQDQYLASERFIYNRSIQQLAWEFKIQPSLMSKRLERIKRTIKEQYHGT
jgi:DNA-directed RNA polymerase specialized sigma subunit